MGIFSKIKATQAGTRAYREHVTANDLNRKGKPAEAKAKYELAAKLYDQAYAEGCRKTNIMIPYSVMLMRQGKFEEARELMKEIRKNDKAMADDTHYELRMNYSICLWRLGELDNAINTLEFAGKTKKNSSYYTSMGMFLVDQARQTGDFANAQKFMNQALDYDDEDAATLDNMGELYLAMAEAGTDPQEKEKLYAQSKEYYLKALEQKETQITSLYHLAEFALKDGDREKATEYVDKAIEYWSSHVCPVSMEMLQALKKRI